jgi:hypothetical protein
VLATRRELADHGRAIGSEDLLAAFRRCHSCAITGAIPSARSIPSTLISTKKMNRALVYELATARFIAQRDDVLLLGPRPREHRQRTEQQRRLARCQCPLRTHALQLRQVDAARRILVQVAPLHRRTKNRAQHIVDVIDG